jgi:hypothetical protein
LQAERNNITWRADLVAQLALMNKGVQIAILTILSDDTMKDFEFEVIKVLDDVRRPVVHLFEHENFILGL